MAKKHLFEYEYSNPQPNDPNAKSIYTVNDKKKRLHLKGEKLIAEFDY